MTTAITNVQIFDGEDVLGERSVVIDQGLIRQVGAPYRLMPRLSTEQEEASCPG